MSQATLLSSAIYRGWIRHRRYIPVRHEFSYRVFMMFLRLDELAHLQTISGLFSKKRFSVFRFKREDFHGNPKANLSNAVKDTVEGVLGFRPAGPVAVLANLRMFGFNMNPLTTYYCYDNQQRVVAILAEVNNTPWDERRAYVLPLNPDSSKCDCVFDKDFTVSPFNPVDMQYHWRSTAPDRSLGLHIDTLLNNQVQTDATLHLQRHDFTPKNLASVVISFPFMTVKVLAAIYWQALRLALKGVPFLGKNQSSVSFGSSGVNEQ